MVDAGPDPDTGNDNGLEPDRAPTESTPTWVKVFGLIALVLIVLLAILLLMGGHAPSRHTTGAAARAAPPLLCLLSGSTLLVLGVQRQPRLHGRSKLGTAGLCPSFQWPFPFRGTRVRHRDI
jgi:hypothetical protein